MGHISRVQDTLLWTRFLDHVSRNLFLLQVSRFYFLIENVGLEPLLCLPGAACCLNTSFSATPAGIEPAPPERQSGVLAVIRWSYIFALFLIIFDPGFLYVSQNKWKAACLIGQAAVSASYTAIYLVIPWLTLSRPVPDIHLIRSY